jgi:hypothetical protein
MRAEAEESLLLEAVARGWLLETGQAEERLAGAAVICKLWRSMLGL